ncbi:MAG: hypothetical protein NC341_01180 [Blautia sp.]|nr:hypothetical protein [Blautia sp.]MCM1202468.1 hypothetical protein [Bacteroides fragilis]
MGFRKKNGQKKEETEPEESKGRSGKKRLGVFLLLCLLAACAAGVYYYLTVYSVTEQASATTPDAESVRFGEKEQDTAEGQRTPEGSRTPEDGLTVENTVENADTEEDGTVQVGNLPEIPAALEDAAAEDAADAKDGLEKGSESDSGFDGKDVSESGSRSDRKDEIENGSEAGVKDEIENDSEAGDASVDEAGSGVKEGPEDVLEMNGKAIDAAEEESAGMMEETTEITNISAYTEEEFRNSCIKADYKKLLRRQELYLNAAVMEELTVLELVDGGLFDENIYYLCKREDEQGITRYYIVRDDREEDTVPVMEGDVLRIYGQLFGSCKLPGYLVRTEPVVPALTMVYYDFLNE